MSKLHQGRSWLTINDTATYIASAIGEPVCEADIFELVTEGSLTLSVYIIDRVHAEIGEVTDDIDLETPPLPMLDGFWRKKRLEYVRGIWDILNDNGGKELLEKKYYSLKGDYCNPQVTNRWIFLNNSDGSVCKLLSATPFDEYSEGDDTYVPATSFPEGFQFVVLKDRIDKLINHLDNQKQFHDKANSFSEREKNSQLNLISALLHVVLGKDGARRHPDFDSEAKLIKHLTQTYGDCGEGLAKSTLEKRFSEAKKILPL